MSITPPPTTRRFRDLADELGQTLTEYALLVSLIAILVIAAFPAVNGALRGLFNTVTAAFGS